jgi:hypothetical protein
MNKSNLQKVVADISSAVDPIFESGVENGSVGMIAITVISSDGADYKTLFFQPVVGAEEGEDQISISEKISLEVRESGLLLKYVQAIGASYTFVKERISEILSSAMNPPKPTNE